MNDAVCRNCGVGINWIMMPSGFGWCHALGARRCQSGDGVAEPEGEATEREKLIEEMLVQADAIRTPPLRAIEVQHAADLMEEAVAALRTPPPVVDREPQLGDGPDYHADRLAWAIRQRHYVRMVDRTLTTADVRQVFLDAHPCRFDHDCPAGAEFDRWLGEHAAQVLEEAADAEESLPTGDPGTAWAQSDSARWLRRRAREYREGTRG